MQVGAGLRSSRAVNPAYQQPRNLGELSIQSHLIALYAQEPHANPLVLFEDGWFLRNAPALPLGTLTSTEAYLVMLEELKIIKSAAKARQAIAAGRPEASLVVHQDDLGKSR